MQIRFLKNNRYPANFVILGWFVGFGLTVYYMTKTFITIDAAFHILVLISVAVTVIQALILNIKDRKILVQMALFNMASVGILLLGLMLLLNYHLSGSSYGEYHALSKRKYQAFAGFEDTRLEDGAYRYFGYVMDLDDPETEGLGDAEAVELQMADGLFGIKVLKGKRFIDLGNESSQ